MMPLWTSYNGIFQKVQDLSKKTTGIHSCPSRLGPAVMVPMVLTLTCTTSMEPGPQGRVETGKKWGGGGLYDDLKQWNKLFSTV